MYRWHTGYVGNMKERTFREMNQRNPERIVELAIKGMLPHNSLGSQMYRKLKVYAGPEHKHEAQNPEVLELNL
jgi:large subunit ribosomal protein L13